ncbi:MAG: hypothetical protein DSY37_02010 [Hyperthermus sp.]|nr:MAG: hypothetical protein DSY37_02010 [Hyperthermus sp.]
MQAEIPLIILLTLSLYSLVMVILTAVGIRSQRRVRGRERIITQVVCENCGYKVTRSFTPGDYVGAKTREKCPRCGSPMRISLIFVEKDASISRYLFTSREPGNAGYYKSLIRLK